jgi:cyclopropane-fatty-acyl-phospholipid synthase
LLYAPNELGLTRAYVAGDLDIEGDIFDLFRLRDRVIKTKGSADLGVGWKGWAATALSAYHSHALGLPLRPPPEEVRLKGKLHSKRRDADAVGHHYNVSNDFYRLLLGKTMTYSCAYFEDADMSLDDAQVAKYRLIERKLGLRPGMRLLDVGAGWAGFVMDASRACGVDATGITISEKQESLASARIKEAGLAQTARVRLQDYRTLDEPPFDAIASVGMFEHVGVAQLRIYLATLYRELKPGGRLLNHAISRPPGPAGFDRDSFIARYVFPDGELQEVGSVVTAMQAEGFEVRDVESLREHYALTLRAWESNLEANWGEAERLVGPARARVWRLYIAGSAINFEEGRINIHQVLAVKPDGSGRSGMPATRKAFV